jgi:hypothetical protein
MKYQDIRLPGSIRSHIAMTPRRLAMMADITCFAPSIAGHLSIICNFMRTYERGCTAAGSLPIASHKKQVGLNSSRHPPKSKPAPRPVSFGV